jgi:predicted lipid-binding transport protein (Tim44 family)
MSGFGEGELLPEVELEWLHPTRAARPSANESDVNLTGAMLGSLMGAVLSGLTFEMFHWFHAGGREASIRSIRAISVV